MTFLNEASDRSGEKLDKKISRPRPNFRAKVQQQQQQLQQQQQQLQQQQQQLQIAATGMKHL